MMRRSMVAAVLFATVLSGCSGNDDPESPAAGESPGSSSSPTVSSTIETPEVDVSSFPEAGRKYVADVRIERLMADVNTLAASPRNDVADHRAALAAAKHVDTRIRAVGLDPRQIDVEAQGVSLPVVWAEIAGAECAERVFVVTGHYDTVEGSPGADDDATGVAAAIEVGRTLKDSHPGASIVVAAVPFEEYGTPYAGSAALGKELQAQKKEIVGMVSAEMLGYATDEPNADGNVGDFLNVLGFEDSQQLVDTFAGAAQAWVPDFKVQAAAVPSDTEFISRSDHAAFHELGVPAAFATDGANFRTPYYHEPDDVPEHIVQPFFRDSVRTLVGGAFAMATVDRDGNGSADACE